MFQKFLPIVQTMIDSFKLNTSGLSSMENLDSTTGLDNDSSIRDSMPLDDAIPFLDEQPSLPFSSFSQPWIFNCSWIGLLIAFSMEHLYLVG